MSIPETILEQAKIFLGTLKDPALMPPFPEPGDLAGWKKLRGFLETDAITESDSIVKRYVPTITERTLGGIAVLDVRPRQWQVSSLTRTAARTPFTAQHPPGKSSYFRQ